MKYEKEIEYLHLNLVHPSKYEKALMDYHSAMKANLDLSAEITLKHNENKEIKEMYCFQIQELKRELALSTNRVQQIEADFEVQLNKIKIDVNSRAHLSWISKCQCYIFRLKWNWDKD